MTTRTTIILLLSLVLVGALLLGCLDDGERIEWQREVLSRQRGLERPTVTPTAERQENDQACP